MIRIAEQRGDYLIYLKIFLITYFAYENIDFVEQEIRRVPNRWHAVIKNINQHLYRIDYPLETLLMENTIIFHDELRLMKYYQSFY